MASNGSVVMEGRDIGSVVFPDARVKSSSTRRRSRACRTPESGMEGRGVPVDPDGAARELRSAIIATGPAPRLP